MGKQTSERLTQERKVNSMSDPNHPSGEFPQRPPVVTGPQIRPNNSIGVAGGVLGIVGIVLIWVPLIGGLLCLLGLIFGLVGTSKGRREGLPLGLAITGIVTGGVGVLIYVVVTLFFVSSGVS